MKTDKGLLERLKDEVGCFYLSALREPEFRLEAAERAVAMEVSDYPQREWCDAVNYLTGERRRFDSAEQARDYLLQWAER